MNKVILAVWMVLLTLSAYGLFSIKYRVYDLKRDVAEINRQLRDEKDEIHVLKAEWTYLNQPERLRVLAEKHLGLKPVSVAQMQPLEYQGIMVVAADGSTKRASSEVRVKEELASAAVRPVLKPSQGLMKVR